MSRRGTAPILVVLAVAAVLAVALVLGSGRSPRPRSSTSSTGSQAGAAPTSSTGAASSASGGSSASTSADQRAAAAFATHAGVAFGTFYRFIYGPYKEGSFNPPKPNREALATARRAAAVVAHEIDMATRAAQGSAALAQLRAPMKTLDEGFQVALVKLKDGHFKLAEIQTANIAISAIKGSAESAGLPIGEHPASI